MWCKETHPKIPNWKSPDRDGIHRFWLKKFTPIHDRLSTETNRCLQEANILEWMTKGKTTLIQKDLKKKPSQITIDQ